MTLAYETPILNFIDNSDVKGNPFKRFIRHPVSVYEEDGKWVKKNFPKGWLDKDQSSVSGCEDHYIVPTGIKNNIIVIDIDKPKTEQEKKNYKDALKFLDCETLITRTCNDGYHVFFKYNDELNTIAGVRALKGFPIDILSNCKGVIQGAQYPIIKDMEISEIPVEINNWFKSRIEPKSTENLNYKDEPMDEDEYEEIESLLDMIPNDDNVDWDFWNNLGLCLHNINTNLLSMWKDWSSRSSKHQDSVCDYAWSRYKKHPKGYKMGSLKRWAKEGNPDAYSERYKRGRKTKEEKEGMTDAELAFILKERAKNILIEGKNDFYIWNDKLLLWEKTNLKKAMCFAFNVLMEDIKDEKVSSNTGRKNIWALTDLQNYEFEEKMDLPNLRWLFIRDGYAYNLETGEKRKRTNLDLTSFELNCSFTEDLDLARNYLNSLMIKNGDDSRLKVLLKYSAYCFTDLPLKLFGIFISEAPDCGKSTYIEFLSSLFGSFKSSVDESAFNNRTNHQTGLWNAVYKKKLSVLIEPKTKKFDEETIKRIVGNDSSQFRVCAEKKTNDYVITTKMIIGTNKRIVLSGENAIADKILYIGFPNQFKKTLENQTKIELLKNNQVFYDGLFTILMEYAKALYREREIIGVDNQYSRSNIYDWVEDECYIDKEDDKCKYSVKEAYQNYQYWCKDEDIKEDKKFFKRILTEITGCESKVARVKDFRGESRLMECYIGINRREGFETNFF